MKRAKAFSLIELSIVILVVGVLIAGVIQGGAVLERFRLMSARTQTESSAVSSIKNLTLWLEPTLGGSFTNSNNLQDIADGDKIKNWNDVQAQAVQKQIVSQTTDSLRPLYKTNVINGLPAVKFDGTNDYLSLTNIVAYDFSAFVVIRTSHVGNSSQYWLGDPILYADFVGSGADIVPLVISGNNIRFGLGGSSGGAAAGSRVVNNDKPHVVNIVRDAAGKTIRGYVDGSLDATRTNTSPEALDANPILYIGANTDSSVCYPGYIAELIIFERVLTAEERNEVVKYLGKKWGITVSSS